MSKKSQTPFFLPHAATLTLLASLTACNATGPCSQHFQSEGEILACKLGAEKIAEKAQHIQDADRLCSLTFDVRAIDPKDPQWFEKATSLADLYNACHTGAAGRLVVEEKQTHQSIQDEGCLQVVGPGRGVICR